MLEDFADSTARFTSSLRFPVPSSKRASNSSQSNNTVVLCLFMWTLGGTTWNQGYQCENKQFREVRRSLDTLVTLAGRFYPKEVVFGSCAENDANDALHRRGWKGRDFAIGFIHLGWNLGLRAELFCERFVRIVTTLLEPKTLCKALTLHWRESRDGAPCAQILEKFLASQAEVSCRSASWPGQLGHLGSFNWNFNILIMKNLIRVPSKTHMILAMDLIHQTFFCFVQKAAIYKSQRWSFEHCWNTGLRKSHLDGILWNSESLQVTWNTIFCHWEMLNVL